MIEITHEVLEKNRDLLKPGEDYWIMQRVTRGLNIVGVLIRGGLIILPRETATRG